MGSHPSSLAGSVTKAERQIVPSAILKIQMIKDVRVGLFIWKRAASACVLSSLLHTVKHEITEMEACFKPSSTGPECSVLS